DHFFTTLARLGARVTGRRALADHVAYTPRILAELAEEADRAEASVLVTTQKDHVKLAALALPRATWQLAVSIEVTAGHDDLARRICDAAASGA
ncbi:MAG: tetraacyldisaccharide 4'-kinase, partial [Phycisphaerae bacterium]